MKTHKHTLIQAGIGSTAGITAYCFHWKNKNEWESRWRQHSQWTFSFHHNHHHPSSYWLCPFVTCFFIQLDLFFICLEIQYLCDHIFILSNQMWSRISHCVLHPEEGGSSPENAIKFIDGFDLLTFTFKSYFIFPRTELAFRGPVKKVLHDWSTCICLKWNQSLQPCQLGLMVLWAKCYHAHNGNAYICLSLLLQKRWLTVGALWKVGIIKVVDMAVYRAVEKFHSERPAGGTSWKSRDKDNL